MIFDAGESLRRVVESSQGFAEGNAKEIWSPLKSAMKHLKSLSYNVCPKAGDQSVCKTSLCPPSPPPN